jgi:hypothetical protein
MLENIIHRLRTRAIEAENQHQVGLAQDLRLTLEFLVRLQRDQQLITRPSLLPKIVA